MDVTPRQFDEAAPRRKRKSPVMYGVLLLIVLAIGFVLFQALNSAALYYRNADEAVRDKASLGTSRFRVQGVVQPFDKTRRPVEFDIAFNNVTVHVVHQGDPPELFQAGLPVVLEGHWQGDVFASDRILVKHSEEYKASNPDRVGSTAP